MKIRRFEFERDYPRIHQFLTDCYNETKTMQCWLPQRFDDLIYRIDTLYRDERGKLASQDFIYFWEEDGRIVAVILPDGDACYAGVRKGYENLYPEMLDVAERELRPLFKVQENGKINFLVVAHDSLAYMTEELTRRGYRRDKDGDYDNYQLPWEKNYELVLLEGYRQVYGEELIDHAKAKACHYGFHPKDDDGILTGPFREGSLSYQARKKSQFFPDSFESLTVTEDGDICSYSFCYVDRKTSTAFIEPVSTREKYRRKGLGKAMLQGIINRLRDEGIEKCYVNSYGEWRKRFYNEAGFITEDSVGFWYKEIA